MINEERAEGFPNLSAFHNQCVHCLSDSLQDEIVKWGYDHNVFIYFAKRKDMITCDH